MKPGISMSLHHVLFPSLFLQGFKSHVDVALRDVVCGGYALLG